jgi:hypothetical protein
MLLYWRLTALLLAMSMEDQDTADRMFADHDMDVPHHPPAHDAGPAYEAQSDDDGDEFSGLADEMDGIGGWYVHLLTSLFNLPH